MSGQNTFLNAQLRIRLAEMNMSFAELARRTELHPITISRVYHRKQRLCAQTVSRIAKILQTTPEAIGLDENGSAS